MSGAVDVGALLESTPAELRELEQWVLYRNELRDGKPAKVPYRADRPDARASSTNPATWSDFETTLDALREGRGAGAGFVFSGDDPYTGIDLDDCIGEDGELHPDVAAIVAELDSYTELSRSGRGLHVLVRAKLKGTRHRTGETRWSGKFEVYDRDRFFCMTGRLLP